MAVSIKYISERAREESLKAGAAQVVRMSDCEKMSFLDFILERGYLDGPNAAAVRSMQQSRFFFGVLALREQLITVEQLEEALAIQGETEGKKLIGEIMVEKGFLTEQQVASVLEMKNHSAANQADLLVDIGMMSPDQVDTAVNEYESYLTD